MFINRNIKVKDNNPLYRFMIGMIFLGMSIWAYTTGYSSENGIDQFDWVYVVLFLLVGIIFVFNGLNILLRKAYIRVDDDKIAFKPDEKTSSETIFWKDILSIQEVDKNFEVHKKDGNVQIIRFSYFDYADALDLKDAIREGAKNKGIPVK